MNNTMSTNDAAVLNVAKRDGFQRFINRIRRLMTELPKAGIICTQLLFFRHILSRFI